MALLLAVATLCVYWPVGRFDFVEYDDLGYVAWNPAVQKGLTLDGLKWAFSTGYQANWHPVTWISHMLDVQIFGSGAAAPHFVNVFFHAANTLLLFAFLYRLTAAMWRSALVAGLFALHPLHVESVAWVAERKDVLSTFFFLLTLLCYAKYASGKKNAGGEKPETRNPNSEGSPKPEIQEPEKAGKKPASSSDFGLSSRFPVSGFYALSLACFALGLMSKPMVVTTPIVLLLLDYWPLRRFEIKNQPRTPSGPESKIKNLFWEKVPFLLLSVVAMVVGVFVGGNS